MVLIFCTMAMIFFIRLVMNFNTQYNAFFMILPPPQVYIPDLYRSDATEHHKMTSISVVTEKNLTHFKMELGLYFKILTGLTKKSKKKNCVICVIYLFGSLSLSLHT